MNAVSFYRFDFLPDKSRIQATYSGVWSEQVARQAVNAFRVALASAGRQGRSFTLLDDFRDWGVQSSQVMEIANSFEKICHAFPITRNAMVIPSASVRRQVRRSLTDFNLSKMFETYEDADAWLAEVEPGAGR